MSRTADCAASTRSRLWDLLKDHEGWLSGEAASAVLGVSRAAIAKHIGVLRREGNRIEAVPNRGYRLVGEAERFSEAALRPLLDTRCLGRDQEWLAETGSTNSVAALRALEGGREGLLVVAEHQVAGRGRRGHVWLCTQESLTFSLLLRPSPQTESTALTRSALQAIASTVQAETGCIPFLKDPNDLLLNGRKISGVLVETGFQGDTPDWVVLGIGLNVNAPAESFSETLNGRATSLLAETGTPCSRLRLLAGILHHLEAMLMP